MVHDVWWYSTRALPLRIFNSFKAEHKIIARNFLKNVFIESSDKNKSINKNWFRDTSFHLYHICYIWHLPILMFGDLKSDISDTQNMFHEHL